MKIISQDKAEKLLKSHKGMVEKRLALYNSIPNPRDKKSHIGNDEPIRFISKVNGVVTQFVIRFSYDLKHINIAEGEAVADSYSFALSDILKDDKAKSKPKSTKTTTTTTSTTTRTTTTSTTTKKVTRGRGRGKAKAKIVTGKEETK